MEGAAFGRVMEMERFRGMAWLIVKGVSDYADQDKDDAYHPYAAAAAATYLLCFIQEYVTQKRLPLPGGSHHLSRDGPAQAWNIPYPRNPVFTGREEMLSRLHEQLQKGPAALAQPQAISGLGGIGKTQIAVEYAYQYGQDYQAVLWSRAETQEALVSGYVEIAQHLNLPQKDEQDQALVVKAVLHWFKTQRQWLLILDNADDLKVVREFLPPTPGGHLLLTTRAQSMGRLASRLEVETMDRDVGALLLLRRATLIAPDASLEAALPTHIALAKEITDEWGGLPLALDQAGAFLEETGCSLADYQQLYQQHRTNLLRERRGLVADHPESVTTTFSLSFVRVEERNPAAADLLRLCAYLAPDAIPEEIIIQGAADLGPRLAPVAADALLLGQAMEVLRAYSLIGRDPATKTLSMHRLVQRVLRDNISSEGQQQWMRRAVYTIEAAYPGSDAAKWPMLERLLPHALTCVDWIEQAPFAASESSLLLNQTGFYLHARARYKEAKPLLERALAICEQQLGVEHPSTANCLNNLALLCRDQGKYEQAEPLLQRALTIYEQQMGEQHPDTANCLNNLAGLYTNQGKYKQAEPLYQRALTIYEQQMGEQHPGIANCLNNLAGLYNALGKYGQAEPLYQRALAIYEQRLGATHPNTASCLNNLAKLYQDQSKDKQAELLLERALVIREQQLGVEHPDTANSLNTLATFYQDQGKYEQAEPLFQRALAIREQQLGAQHPDTAQSLGNLALLYLAQNKYEQAEPLLERALAICEQQLGETHPFTAPSLNDLARLYQNQGKYEQAEPLYERALAICENVLGRDHRTTHIVRRNYATLLQTIGRDVKYEQAEPLLQEALALCEQQLGAMHPDTAMSLNDLALLYSVRGKYAEAEPLYQRALTIYEQALRPQHPSTQRVRENYALLLRAMGRDAEAASLEAKQTPPSAQAQ